MNRNGVTRHLIDFLIRTIGYRDTIMVKDFVVFLAGVSIGILIMSVVVGRVMHRTRSSEDLGKVTSVKFIHDSKVYYFTRVNNFYESMEFIFMVILLPFSNRREYTISGKRRARWLVNIVFALIILLMVLSVLFVLNPIISPDKIHII